MYSQIGYSSVGASKPNTTSKIDDVFKWDEKCSVVGQYSNWATSYERNDVSEVLDQCAYSEGGSEDWHAGFCDSGTLIKRRCHCQADRGLFNR